MSTLKNPLVQALFWFVSRACFLFCFPKHCRSQPSTTTHIQRGHRRALSHLFVDDAIMQKAQCQHVRTLMLALFWNVCRGFHMPLFYKHIINMLQLCSSFGSDTVKICPTMQVVAVKRALVSFAELVRLFGLKRAAALAEDAEIPRCLADGRLHYLVVVEQCEERSLRRHWSAT